MALIPQNGAMSIEGFQEKIYIPIHEEVVPCQKRPRINPRKAPRAKNAIDAMLVYRERRKRRLKLSHHRLALVTK